MGAVAEQPHNVTQLQGDIFMGANTTLNLHQTGNTAGTNNVNVLPDTTAHQKYHYNDGSGLFSEAWRDDPRFYPYGEKSLIVHFVM